MTEPKFPFNDPNDDDSSKWTMVSMRKVAPPSKRVPEWMTLSLVDSLPTGAYLSYAFFYRPQEWNEPPSPVDRFCESLSKALEIFYPLAGCLFKNAGEYLPRLFCNDAGVPVVHKRYDGLVSERIDLEHFRPCELLTGVREFNHDFDLDSASFPASGLPVSIIQVTDFLCGTRCVTVTCSHHVADVFSLAHFLKSWAEIRRNEPISLSPTFDRGLLAPRKTSAVLDGAPVRFLHKGKIPKPLKSTRPEEGLGCLTLRIGRTKVEDLKREASSSSGSKFSSADCVSAHLWRTITKLRNHEPHELTRFITIVNIRSRLKDFPAGYFGNAVTASVCVERVGKLLSEPLSYAASIIHEAVQAMDDNAARGWVDWLSMPSCRPFCVGDEPFMPGDPAAIAHSVLASWQNRFPFFDFDLGFGKPHAVLRNGFRMGHKNAMRFVVMPTETEEMDAMLYFENSVIGAIKDVL